MSSNLKKSIAHFFKSVAKNKKLNTYALFLFISFSFWFLSMLSKTHETTLFVPVNYKNYPADLVEIISPIDFIEVRVKAPGFSIIFYHFFNFKTLKLDYEIANSKPLQNGQNLFWILNSKREEVANILGSSMEIMDLSPERLIVPFANKTKKDVPIKLFNDITLKSEYWLSSEIQLNPEKITIYGDQNILDSLTEISTELLKLDNVFENTSIKVDLIIPEGLETKETELSVIINVEQFIELKMFKKIKVENLKKGFTLKLFPDEISATIRLPKSKYNFLKTDFLNITVDATKLDEDENTKRLKVQVNNLPSFVKLERLYPQEVEFLLIKD
tara:strand:- start:49 stop:1038 length:990 start_codon:yes stop_codon:yes gene_type:complete